MFHLFENVGHYVYFAARALLIVPLALRRPREVARQLAEVLLGNVAYRCGKELRWDTEAGRAPNAPEADAFLRREYRRGWTL